MRAPNLGGQLSKASTELLMATTHLTAAMKRTPLYRTRWLSWGEDVVAELSVDGTRVGTFDGARVGTVDGAKVGFVDGARVGIDDVVKLYAMRIVV